NGNSGSSKEEKVCRICHFGSEASSGSSELYPIGCDCKGELGLSHRRCADAWFELKGNRSRDSSRSRTCKKSLWNIILVCLILAFVLPWFFRDMF
ncbi:hypothetical protein MIMGU_mgv1a024640mg, partial [Erythranthe guttata]